MSLIAMYGVNAVGKDTVANLIQEQEGRDYIRLTSESRLLMHHLGLIPSIETKYRVSRDIYKKLEDTPQSIILELIETKYRDHLEILKSETAATTFLLSHLVFALNLDKDRPVYLLKDIPDWTREVFNGFIHLRAPISEIIKRRHQDEEVRDRGAMEYSQIRYHQGLCDRKWEELVYPLHRETYTEVWNVELEESVKEIRTFKERFR